MKPIFSVHTLLVSVLGFALVAGYHGRLQQSASTLATSSLKSSLHLSDSTGLYLPENLEATLWAESPMVNNPTNMDVDARGRIWVTEAVNYRSFQNKKTGSSAGERIVILEDTDGDGRADNSKVFVTDSALVAPMGIAVVGKKVIVSAAPNLIVYTDENGDDVADRKEILLTGFGGTDHDHSLHALTTGPDGRYYINVGNAGPHVVTDKSGFTLRSGSMFTGGSPHNKLNHGNQVSDDGRVWAGGLVLRLDPDGSNLHVMAHNLRNSYETALDSYGNMWVTDNDDEVNACRTGWLMEGANAGFFSPDGTRSWRADQQPNQAVPLAHWHQNDPGVEPLGLLTGAGSPTGLTMYEGDELGLQYRGALLGADAGLNTIFAYKTDPVGAGFSLTRTPLVSSMPEQDATYKWNKSSEDKRKWFRPSDVTVGTDGALYIADWYDPVVGGHQMQDKTGYGRIYRVTPKGKTLKNPRLDLRTTQGQLGALQNPAVNVRMLGFDALSQQGEKAIEPVKSLLASANPYYRARAIFLLAQLGAEGQFEVEQLLKSPDAPIRITALRALRSITPENSKAKPALTPSQEALLPLLGNLSTDRNPAVRREVAVALRDVSYQDSRRMLLNLLKGYDGQDRYYLTALGEAVDGKEEALFNELRLNSLPENPIDWDQRMADVIWEIHPATALPMLKKRAEATTLSPEARQQAISTIAFLKTPQAAQVMVELMRSPDKAIAEQAAYWTEARRGNDWASYLKNVPTAAPKQQNEEQRLTAKRQQLLDEQTSEAEKRKIAIELSREAAGALVLIDMAANKQLSEDLIKAAGPGIRTNKDPNVRTLGKTDFPWKNPAHTTTQSATASPEQRPAEAVNEESVRRTVVTEVASEPVKTAPVSTVPVQAIPTEPAPAPVVPRVEATPRPKPMPTPASEPATVEPTRTTMLVGNEQRGQRLFETKCASCHRYGQDGANIGPNLTRVGQKLDREQLIESIVNPSASIAHGYEPWMITTKKGQTYYGFLVSDSDQTVVVRGIKGFTHTLPANDIFSRRQYKVSLMPDAKAMGLDDDQLNDLTAFLLRQK